ncbi:hypothetical protein ES703_121146 [subsurface metagenome]
MKAKNFLLLILFGALVFTACEKGPGEGGTSTIRGKVIMYEYSRDLLICYDTLPGAREDVYIIYGDDAVYGDRFETSWDGTYEFNYLREGHYTVFT